MNPQQRELYRAALLRVLDANETQWGLSASVVEIHAAQFGFRHSGVLTVDKELRYLRDKGLVDNPSKTISPENQTWRITATGRDWLAQNG